MIKNGIAGSWESFFVNYLITLYFGFGIPSPWPFSCLSIVFKHISFFSFSSTFSFFPLCFSFYGRRLDVFHWDILLFLYLLNLDRVRWCPLWILICTSQRLVTLETFHTTIFPVWIYVFLGEKSHLLYPKGAKHIQKARFIQGARCVQGHSEFRR